MYNEKITMTVNSALTHLEKAIKLHYKRDEKKVLHLMWKASSDLEQALFLFKFQLSQENQKLLWKLPVSKQPEIQSLLISTRDILIDVVKNLESDYLNEAHKKTWMAKGQLLKINDFVDKQERKARDSIH